MTMQTFVRYVTAGLLGTATALLVSCGSTGSSLIPVANAGPLQSDFEAVALAAQSGNGSCVETEAKLGKTEQDFLALPASVDRGLHTRLDEGIKNLRRHALVRRAQVRARWRALLAVRTACTVVRARPRGWDAHASRHA